MAGKVDQYRAALRGKHDWEPYLKAHSGLPGPRANLELVQAVGDEARPDMLWRWTSSADEFLALCGTAGLGRLALEDDNVLPRLRELATDPRWRVREGVAIALQRLGRNSMSRLVSEMDSWAGDRPYVQRAAAAALCEPPLLKDLEQVRHVLAILDGITSSLAEAHERRDEEHRVLRQALGYCWSVAAAAAPGPGRSMIEKWLRSDDADLRWVMKSNLAKARMSALGADWLAAKRKAFER